MRPCTDCRRLIREDVCPFCGGARNVGAPPAIAAAPWRLRAVALAALAGTAACTEAAVPFYGAPCMPDCGTIDVTDASDESPRFPDVAVDAPPDAPLDAVLDARDGD